MKCEMRTSRAARVWISSNPRFLPQTWPELDFQASTPQASVHDTRYARPRIGLRFELPRHRQTDRQTKRPVSPRTASQRSQAKAVEYIARVSRATRLRPI